jgi:hypothetical protein
MDQAAGVWPPASGKGPNRPAIAVPRRESFLATRSIGLTGMRHALDQALGRLPPETRYMIARRLIAADTGGPNEG